MECNNLRPTLHSYLKHKLFILCKIYVDKKYKILRFCPRFVRVVDFIYVCISVFDQVELFYGEFIFSHKISIDVASDRGELFLFLGFLFNAQSM